VRRSDPSQVKLNWQPVVRWWPWKTTPHTVCDNGVATRFSTTWATPRCPNHGLIRRLIINRRRQAVDRAHTRDSSAGSVKAARPGLGPLSTGSARCAEPPRRR
jgi:hypothetical protein